jgi:hypothetical protein
MESDAATIGKIKADESTWSEDDRRTEQAHGSDSP